MGFGLWPAFDSREVTGVQLLRELEGKTIAVDVAIWVVESLAQKANLPWLKEHELALKLCFERIVTWLRCGVTPVIVLEGNAGSRGKRAGRPHQNIGNAFAQNMQAIENLCHYLGVACTRAAGEAEAWCVCLAQEGLVDAIATNDCDVFAFGAVCPVLKDLRILDRISASSAEIVDSDASRRHLTREAFILVAALLGNEYDGDGGSGTAHVGLQISVPGLQWFQTQQHDTPNISLVDAFYNEVVSTSTKCGRLVESLRKLPSCTGCARCGHGNVRKPAHGNKGCSACGTKQGCLPRIAVDGSDRIKLCECGYCSAVREKSNGDEVAHGRARKFALILDSVRADEAFGKRLRQTADSFQIPCVEAHVTLHPEAFEWRGLHDVDALSQLLSGIFKADSVAKKIMMLKLEWCLRVAAREAPRALEHHEQTPTSLATWAQRRGLEFVPQRRRRAFSDAHLTVLLDWQSLNSASASDAEVMQNLPPSKRHGRASLVRRLGSLVRIPDSEAKLEAERLADTALKAPRQTLLKDHFGKAAHSSEPSARAPANAMEAPAPSPSTPKRIRCRSASPGSSQKQSRSHQVAGSEGDGTAANASEPKLACVAVEAVEAPVPSPSTPTRVRCRNASPCSSRKRPRWRHLAGSSSVDSGARGSVIEMDKGSGISVQAKPS
jgi:hypothetical protein